MKPKKPNKIYAEVAEELNIPETKVNDIVSFYWSQVRRTMESLDDPYIDIDNLGMLYVKPKSLEMEIIKNETYVKQINPNNLKKFEFYNTAQTKLKKFAGLKQKIAEEKAGKIKFKTNVYATKNQENLED